MTPPNVKPHQCRATDDDGRPLEPDRVTCGSCGRAWCERCHPTPAALCPWCCGSGPGDAALQSVDQRPTEPTRKEYMVTVNAVGDSCGSYAIEAGSPAEALRIAREDALDNFRSRDIAFDPDYTTPFRDYGIEEIEESESGARIQCLECGDAAGGCHLCSNSRVAYSAFLLEDGGTWDQPTFWVPAHVARLSDPDREIERALFRHYGRRYFYVCGIQEDPDGAEDPEYVGELYPGAWV